MKCIYLGKENIKKFNDIYDVFQKELNLPDYFGRNMDALHDCVAEYGDKLLIVIADDEKLSDKIGIKYPAFLRMLDDMKDDKLINIRYLTDKE